MKCEEHAPNLHSFISENNSIFQKRSGLSAISPAFILAISLPILGLTITSTVVTVLVLIYAFYLTRKSNPGGGKLNHSILTPTGKLFPEEISYEQSGYHKDWLAIATSRWSEDEFHEHLASIMESEEITIFKTLADFLFEDKVLVNPTKGTLPNTDEAAGYRNKYRISKESGVSQDRFYGSDGIMEYFLDIGLVENRKPEKEWGGQKEIYRLNLNHELVRAYLNIILSQ